MNENGWPSQSDFFELEELAAARSERLRLMQREIDQYLRSTRSVAPAADDLLQRISDAIEEMVN
jgi:hypothetical protein